MLKIEDSKTAYLKAGDSKYAFMCWEPQNNLMSLERNCIMGLDQALKIKASKKSLKNTDEINHLHLSLTMTVLTRDNLSKRFWRIPQKILKMTHRYDESVT